MQQQLDVWKSRLTVFYRELDALTGGLVSYELVYGSLGTVVALLFWIYLSATITLFGAHLSAVIDRRNEN